MRALDELKALKQGSEGFDGSPSEAVPGPVDKAEEWLARIEALADKPPPEGANPRLWLLMLDGARSFVERWGEQAAKLGWTEGELFRLTKSLRLDQRGAAFLVADKEVVGITAFAISVRVDGVLQRIPRDREGVEGWLSELWEALA